MKGGATQSIWRIFRVPILVAAALLTGALLALLFEGPIDLVWSALVAAPVFVLVRAWLLRRRA